jgi:hypothetical protein
VPARVVGKTGGDALRIAVAGQIAIETRIDEAERVWNSSLEMLLSKRVA